MTPTRDCASWRRVNLPRMLLRQIPEGVELCREERNKPMTEMGGLHVVVGASGATGRVLVRELDAKGERVRAVNRSGRADVPEGVEVAAADATDRGRMREACRGAAVVYHCAMPPFRRWVELFPR